MVTTPQVWDEARNLSGQQGEVVYLGNGNILSYYIDPNTSPLETLAVITDTVGNVVTAPFLISLEPETGVLNAPEQVIYDVKALPSGGFAVVSSNRTFDDASLNFDIFDASGVLVQSSILNPNLPLGQDFDFSNSAGITVRSNGSIFVTATASSIDLTDVNDFVVGWNGGLTGTFTLPFIIDDNNTIGLNVNAEDPIHIDTIEIDNTQVATLIIENDSFSFTSRPTINIVIRDGNNAGTVISELDLTTAGGGGVGNGSIDTNFTPSIVYIGLGDMVVLYKTDASNGGDGNWYLARFDGTNFNGSPLTDTDLLDTGSQSQVNIQPTLTALENSNGIPNGEYLVSFIDETNNEIFIQRYDRSNDPIGSPVEIDIQGGSDYSIELLDGNRFVVLFENPNGNTQQIIYTYDDESGLFDAAGNYLGTIDNDNVFGMSGVPGFFLSAGNDTVTEANFDDGVFIDMGADDDIFFASLGNNPDYANNLTIDGGSGFDFYLASSANSTQNITVDFATGGVITVDGISTSRTITNFEGFISGAGSDDIRADDNDNTLSGGGGADFLSGRGGVDLLNGGGGNDILFGGGDEDEVNGNADDDIIIGGSGGDILNGDIGNDTFYQWNHSGNSVGFTDTIDGGDDFDTIIMQVYNADGPTFFSGTDYNFNLSTENEGTIIGGGEVINFTNIEALIDGTGDATFIGSSGNDQFFGNGGADTITGGDGVDILAGGGDDDKFIYTDTGDLFGGTIEFQGAVLVTELIDGGDGIDRIVVDFADGDELELNEAGITSIEEIEFAQSQVQGQTNSILLNASQVVEDSRSFANNLNIIGSNAQGSFSDIIDISMGDETVVDLSNWTFENWGRDNQTIRISGDSDDEMITGTIEDDLLLGRGGADILNGGSGSDTASYQFSNEGIKIFTSGRLSSGGEAQGDQLTDIENIIGSDQQDQIVLDAATAVDNTVNAGDGDDRIRERDGGTNTLNGEGGEDRIFGGTGIDIIDGGDGEDDLFGAGGDDIIFGGDDDARDTLFGSSGDDELTGGGGNDALRGNTGEDILNGGDGTDNLQGGNQNDTLNGDAGVDTLDGGAGNDILNGGTGNDRLIGGGSNDLFIFEDGSGIDRIEDFNFGSGDQIDLTSFGLADFDAVMALATEVNGDVRIQLDTDDRLILEDITLAELDADDFILA